MKILGIVTLYNPPKEVGENLSSYGLSSTAFIFGTTPQEEVMSTVCFRLKWQSVC